MNAEAISAELTRRWPPSEYAVHIQVIGGAAGGGISVRVWNSRGIKESEIAYAADHAGCKDPIAAAAVEEVEFIVSHLMNEGRLMKNFAEQAVDALATGTLTQGHQ
jgi:hypothetical protein